MKKRFIAIIPLLMLLTSVNAYADVGTYIFDDAGLFTDAELVELNEVIYDTMGEVGFAIAIMTCDDVGTSKSDRAVVDMVDVFYEEQFGINSDGIILLINKDPDSRYHYISTSGYAIRLFTDARIDYMFDYFWDDLMAENYSEVVRIFCDSIATYSDKGFEQNSHIYDTETGEITYYRDNTFPTEMIFVVLIAVILIFTITFFSVNKRYKIQPQKMAANYLKHDTVRYTQKTDTFIRQYVTKTRINTDSGGGGGGGGRSSTHTSSGGGNHGGGGRRG